MTTGEGEKHYKLPRETSAKQIHILLLLICNAVERLKNKKNRDESVVL
jgi:hypothetical protein